MMETKKGVPYVPNKSARMKEEMYVASQSTAEAGVEGVG
jgi:hypothetical protein